MENNVNNFAAKNDWQTEKDLLPTDASMINEFGESNENENAIEEENKKSRYTFSSSNSPDPDDEEEDEDEEDDTDEEEDESGDWGHTDPAEGNSPFPDSNDPSFPGSAI